MERQDNFQMSNSNNYYENVFRCPHNKSTAKMLYTFSKAGRFGPQKKLLCDKIYNIPNTIHKRATSFGYGTKSDFTKNAEKTPSPNNYVFKGITQLGKEKKMGYSFGKGRDDLQITGSMAFIKSNKNPGPGAYGYKSTLNKSGFSFPVSQPAEDKEHKTIPGPGNYQTLFSFDPNGKYFCSKFKNSRAASFSADHEKRFRNKITRTPGPGAYRIDLKTGGSEFISKFRSCVAQTFPHSPRKVSISHQAVSKNHVTEIPGPGYYEVPTDFGCLDNSSNKQNHLRTDSR